MNNVYQHVCFFDASALATFDTSAMNTLYNNASNIFVNDPFGNPIYPKDEITDSGVLKVEFNDDGDRKVAMLYRNDEGKVIGGSAIMFFGYLAGTNSVDVVVLQFGEDGSYLGVGKVQVSGGGGGGSGDLSGYFFVDEDGHLIYNPDSQGTETPGSETLNEYLDRTYMKLAGGSFSGPVIFDPTLGLTVGSVTLTQQSLEDMQTAIAKIPGLLSETEEAVVSAPWTFTNAAGVAVGTAPNLLIINGNGIVRNGVTYNIPSSGGYFAMTRNTDGSPESVLPIDVTTTAAFTSQNGSYEFVSDSQNDVTFGLSVSYNAGALHLVANSHDLAIGVNSDGTADIELDGTSLIPNYDASIPTEIHFDGTLNQLSLYHDSTPIEGQTPVQLKTIGGQQIVGSGDIATGTVLKLHTVTIGGSTTLKIVCTDVGEITDTEFLFNDLKASVKAVEVGTDQENAILSYAQGSDGALTLYVFGSTGTTTISVPTESVVSDSVSAL